LRFTLELTWFTLARPKTRRASHHSSVVKVPSD
jgi:hypothetical protein